MGNSQAKGKKPSECKGVSAASDNEDDYENVTPEDRLAPQPPPLPRTTPAALKQRNKGGADLPLPKPVARRRCPRKSLLISYILLGVCFLTCGAFLTLAVMKRPELQQDMEELSLHLPQMTSNVSQELAEIMRGWEKIQADVAALKKDIGPGYLLVSAELAAMEEFHNEIQAQITALQKTIGIRGEESLGAPGVLPSAE